LITRFPILFWPDSWSAVSSALNEDTSNFAPRDFIMSSSIEPDVVTRTFGILREHSCAKSPLSPDVTMLEVKVRNIFAFSRFALRRTCWAAFSSIDW